MKVLPPLMNKGRKENRVFFTLDVYDFMMTQYSWRNLHDIRKGLNFPDGYNQDKYGKRIRRALNILTKTHRLIVEKLETDAGGYKTNYWRRLKPR